MCKAISAIMYTYYFEKLEVWQLSKDLMKEIYLITKEYPKSEFYGITSQLKRSSLSIPTNIAEGTGRESNKDQAHFTTMAYASLMEVLNLLIVSYELNLISKEKLLELRSTTNHISNKLIGLRNAQLKRNTLNRQPS